MIYELGSQIGGLKQSPEKQSLGIQIAQCRKYVQTLGPYVGITCILHSPGNSKDQTQEFVKSTATLLKV